MGGVKSFKGSRIGIDVGATSVGVCMDDGQGDMVSVYRNHRGEPESVILDIVDELDVRADAVAITGSGGRGLAERLNIFYVDSAVALIAAQDNLNDIRHIIDIGGGSLSIVDIDAEGRFSGYRTNSMCAAGTGSFLDEQALRMGLDDVERASRKDVDEPPRIAARCAVFAKSDLIHRQQEGFSIVEMWSGLCRGMVQTALSTLFRGRKPEGSVLLAGGVAKNLEVVRWMERELDANLIIPKNAEVYGAQGALNAARSVEGEVRWNDLKDMSDDKGGARRDVLELKISNYPSFGCDESYVEDGTEVRLHKALEGEVVLGIDIGSTSTKAAVLDLAGNVIADFYRRTSGAPIEAIQKLLKTIHGAARGKNLDVKGVGTTGSGRKMIGIIIGADRIVNEITAHVKGAVATDPDVETIFEIGGQDSKFIALSDGVPRDSNMNYICAAGTGSFIEEQAGKLGFELRKIGDSVMGTRPPFSSDRCTVFMEQDVHHMIRKGFSSREAMGSVLCSVVQNYLNRVVGRRPYSRKKICFMGATARNKGLVAAFEQLTGAPMVVSPYCHVMGAFGVARVVLDEVVDRGEKTTFRGLGFADVEVTLERDVCTLCNNVCRITRARVGDSKDAPSWGYMCGRDPDDNRLKVHGGFKAFKEHERLWANSGKLDGVTSGAKKIGIPRALLTYTYLPFWKRFFAELGCEVVLSDKTNDDTMNGASDLVGADYCYPVKLAHGHVFQLAKKTEVDVIFLPFVVQGEAHDDGFERSVFCPYNISFPSIAKVAGLSESSGKSIISAVINFQLSMENIVGHLSKEVGATLGKSKAAIERAWLAARGVQDEYVKNQMAIGKEFLEKLEESGERGVVVLGRPYNVYDLGANLNMPQKIADLGVTVLSTDMLPLTDIEIDKRYNNMYWKYGRKILQAAKFVAAHPQLNAVFLTNFGCGPDSFLQTYVEEIMGDKPMLMLELDEHSADAGYITRLEAFRDVILGRDEERMSVDCKTIEHGASDSDVRTLWIPPMHPYGTPFLAAALRYTGLPARPLPPETPESFAIAKKYCRGTECVPAPATIGAFLSVLEKSDDPEKECFFMPSAKGPCRFGQYHTLHKMILESAGYPNTPVKSWSDESGTYGMDMKTSRYLFNAMSSADLLYKARCRIRPYAADRDEFDRIMAGIVERFEKSIEEGKDLKKVLTGVVAELSNIKRVETKKPLVGIVGEIYVRINPFTNGNLIETIEDAGGEAWMAPFIEWFHYLTFMDSVFAKEKELSIKARMKLWAKNAFMMRMESSLTKIMAPIIGDRAEPSIVDTVGSGEEVFPRQFDGESILTVGRAMEFAKDGVDLIINCAPFGCMPGTLTAGIFQKLESKMGVPTVSIFYDGEADHSHLVRTYLANVMQKGYSRGLVDRGMDGEGEKAGRA